MKLESNLVDTNGPMLIIIQNPLLLRIDISN